MLVKRLSQAAQLPTRAHNSAGYDLYSPYAAILPPGQVAPVPLAIASEFGPTYVAVIKDRSGMGKKGIHVFGGVVDSDYRGEWMVLLFNSTDRSYEIKAGDRIAQFLLLPFIASVVEEGELSPTARNAGGLGSTGR